MFLHSVDVSWLDNPFWNSRFQVTQQSEIDDVRNAGASTVVIDTDRGAVPSAPPAPITFAAAREEAAIVLAHSKATMKGIFEGARLGEAIQCEEVRRVVEEIAGSIRVHPQALIDMVRLKTKDEYTYLHSVAVCALMVNLSRQLGLDEATSRDLGLAGLVHDIGKTAMPTTILNKPGKLDDAEFEMMRTHPTRGSEILRQTLDLPATVFDVCHHHHEKIDGTGYPFGLKGDEISLPARMGAICDVYDALTSNRAYKDGWSPTAAVRAMSLWTGQFDRAVLFAFYHSIGVFPTGLLVRMESQHLAIVLSNGRRGSRTQVRLFYDIDKQALILPRDMVLASAEAQRSIVAEENAADWPIHDWPSLKDHLLGDTRDLSQIEIRRLWNGPAQTRSAA